MPTLPVKYHSCGEVWIQNLKEKKEGEKQHGVVGNKRAPEVMGYGSESSVLLFSLQVKGKLPTC